MNGQRKHCLPFGLMVAVTSSRPWPSRAETTSRFCVGLVTMSMGPRYGHRAYLLALAHAANAAMASTGIIKLFIGHRLYIFEWRGINLPQRAPKWVACPSPWLCVSQAPCRG